IWLTATDRLERDGVTHDAEITSAHAQPPGRVPGRERRRGRTTEGRKCTIGSHGSKRAGRVAEGKAQVTHSLGGAYDRTRTKVVGDCDREQGAGCSEISACGKWYIGPRSARIKSD